MESFEINKDLGEILTKCSGICDKLCKVQNIMMQHFCYL